MLVTLIFPHDNTPNGRPVCVPVPSNVHPPPPLPPFIRQPEQ